LIASEAVRAAGERDVSLVLMYFMFVSSFIVIFL